MPSALITGTSTGIGLETARLFAQRGYRVYAGARSPAASEGLQRAVAEGLFITPIVLDVDQDDSVHDAVARVGPVDVLVNNAGIGSAGAVELMPMEEIRAIFETNVFGAVRMLQAVLPSMRQRRAGAIVNVTSMMGRITLPCHGFYAATKFALSAISETLAMEVKRLGVRVAIIEPGVILTPIWGKRAPAFPRGARVRPRTGPDVAHFRGADGRWNDARRCRRGDLSGGHRGRATPRSRGRRRGDPGRGAGSRDSRRVGLDLHGT